MKTPTTMKGRLVSLLTKLGLSGPWRNQAEAFVCRLGHKHPTNRTVLSFCRHMGTQLLTREGPRFERVATFVSGGKMSCTGLNGVSETGIMYYFLGTINGQTEDERPMEHLLTRTIRSGDTFLDIGANYGFYSFLLGPLCGKSGAVHSFDANPVLRQHLVRSAELNQATANITINNVAVGSKALEEVILFNPERIGVSSLYQHEWLDTSSKVSIPQITIDDYVTRKKITRIAAIKIDIEGAELDAFRGMEQTFKNCPPSMIVCELMPLVNTTNLGENPAADLKRAESAANPVDIMDFLSAHGYETRYIEDPGGRLAGVIPRDTLLNLSHNIINVAFVRPELRDSRPDLYVST